MKTLEGGVLQFDVGLAIDGRTPIGDKDIEAVRAMLFGARVMARASEEGSEEAQRFQELSEAAKVGLQHTSGLEGGFFVLDHDLAEYGARALERYRDMYAIPHADAVWASDTDAMAIERNYGQLCEAAGLPEPQLYSPI